MYFADDTSIFYTSAKLQHLEFAMKEELKLVFKHCITNKQASIVPLTNRQISESSTADGISVTCTCSGSGLFRMLSKCSFQCASFSASFKRTFLSMPFTGTLLFLKPLFNILLINIGSSDLVYEQLLLPALPVSLQIFPCLVW